MKHIKLIFEADIIEDPADSLNLPGETDYSALSSDELMILIDQAAADNDFKEVERLNFYLRKELNPNAAPDLLTIEGYVYLNESVAEAKLILRKLADEEISRARTEIDKTVEALPQEEQEAAYSEAVKEIEDSFYRHPDYLEIQDIFKSSPKYIGTFVMFRFIQGAPIEQLRQLANLIIQLRLNLDELPKQPDEYAKIKNRAGEVPGYEKLGDELNRLLELSRGRWLVKALPKVACSTSAHISAGLGPVNLRELYAAATKEKKNELLRLAAQINDLDKPALIAAIRIELSGKPSIDAIITDLSQKLNSANTDRGELYQKAVEAYPSVAVLYDGPNHLVFSFRTDAQLPYLCGKAAGWCIQPEWYNSGFAGRFWSYASGSLQLGVLDYSVDSTTDFHTVGFTISPNGTVSSSCNQPNRCALITGENYKEMMKGWSASGESHAYPQDVIDAISLVFDAEVKTKTSTDAIYKKIFEFSRNEKDKSEAMKKTILGLVRNTEDLMKSTNSSFGDISAQENINKQVIAAELKNLRNSSVIKEVQQEYIDRAKNKGLISPADVKIFEIVMDASAAALTDQLIKNIKDRNTTFINKISEMLPKAKSLSPATLDRWKEVVNTITDANTYLDSMILKIQGNNEKK
jgi:hypothetical protein